MYLQNISAIFYGYISISSKAETPGLQPIIEEYSAKRGSSPIWLILRKMAKQILFIIAGNGLQTSDPKVTLLVHML